MSHHHGHHQERRRRPGLSPLSAMLLLCATMLIVMSISNIQLHRTLKSTEQKASVAIQEARKNTLFAIETARSFNAQLLVAERRRIQCEARPEKVRVIVRKVWPKATFPDYK